MIRNKDFALLYAGRAVFDKSSEYAGVVVGWNDIHGVIMGVDHGGMKLVSMGDGLENVSSKT